MGKQSKFSMGWPVLGLLALLLALPVGVSAKSAGMQGPATGNLKCKVIMGVSTCAPRPPISVPGNSSSPPSGFICALTGGNCGSISPTTSSGDFLPPPVVSTAATPKSPKASTTSPKSSATTTGGRRTGNTGASVAPPSTQVNGTRFGSPSRTQFGVEMRNENSRREEMNQKSYSADEIRSFTASGGFRDLESPSTEDTYSSSNSFSENVYGGGVGSAGVEYSLGPSEENGLSKLTQDGGTQNALSHSEKLDSLLLSDDPWVAQMARTTLPAVVNQIREDSEVRKNLKERLEALLAKRPNTTAQEEKMAALMEAALAEAEFADPEGKELASLKSMDINEAFKLDPEDTKSGVERMIAELEYEAEFLPKQSLFERISSAHRKVLSQKRL